MDNPTAGCTSDRRCEAINYSRRDQICSRMEQPEEYKPDSQSDFGVKRQRP